MLRIWATSSSNRLKCGGCGSRLNELYVQIRVRIHKTPPRPPNGLREMVITSLIGLVPLVLRGGTRARQPTWEVCESDISLMGFTHFGTLERVFFAGDGPILLELRTMATMEVLESLR